MDHGSAETKKAPMKHGGSVIDCFILIGLCGEKFLTYKHSPLLIIVIPLMGQGALLRLHLKTLDQS